MSMPTILCECAEEDAFSYHFFGNEDETIPDDVSDLVIHPLVQFIPRRACAWSRKLANVNFNGSALKVIQECAFLACHALREVDIPKSVTEIEQRAFQQCQSLKTVRFHEDSMLTTIGTSAFAYCRSLTNISIPSSVETIQSNAFHGCECLARVAFQEGLKIIEDGGFANCAKLEAVDIPGTLEMMGTSAFSRCTSLKEVNIEEGNLRVIGEHAFESCANMQTISIPSTVERIETDAFRCCDSLGVVKFRNGLKHVAFYAFYLCKTLQAVELPKSIESIGSFAFGNCPQLVSVGREHTDKFVRIDDNAFAECESLINICLPDIVRPGLFGGVASNSFRGCTALENQYGESPVPTVLVHRFDNFPIHKKCYQVSETTSDELAREIESLKQSSQEDTFDHLVDPFGMTPFHVLLSAAKCRIDLLHVLLDAYPPNVLGWKDVNGKTSIEYMTQRSYLDEDSRTMLRVALEGWLVDPISSWNGLDVWKLDTSNRVNAIVAEDEVEQRESLLEGASMIFSKYERIEATTLLELSLWKMEMKPASASADDAARSIVDKDDREACRIRSGASVVISNLIAILYETSTS